MNAERYFNVNLCNTPFKSHASHKHTQIKDSAALAEAHFYGISVSLSVAAPVHSPGSACSMFTIKLQMKCGPCIRFHSRSPFRSKPSLREIFTTILGYKFASHRIPYEFREHESTIHFLLLRRTHYLMLSFSIDRMKCWRRTHTHTHTQNKSHLQRIRLYKSA